MNKKNSVQVINYDPSLAKNNPNPGIFEYKGPCDSSVVFMTFEKTSDLSDKSYLGKDVQIEMLVRISKLSKETQQLVRKELGLIKALIKDS